MNKKFGLSVIAEDVWLIRKNLSYRNPIFRSFEKKFQSYSLQYRIVIYVKSFSQRNRSINEKIWVICHHFRDNIHRRILLWPICSIKPSIYQIGHQSTSLSFRISCQYIYYERSRRKYILTIRMMISDSHLAGDDHLQVWIISPLFINKFILTETSSRFFSNTIDFSPLNVVSSLASIRYENIIMTRLFE